MLLLLLIETLKLLEQLLWFNIYFQIIYFIFKHNFSTLLQNSNEAATVLPAGSSIHNGRTLMAYEENSMPVDLNNIKSGTNTLESTLDALKQSSGLASIAAYKDLIKLNNVEELTKTMCPMYFNSTESQR